jgi:hypothetical protein
LDTGVKELFSTKSDHRCHFFDPIFLNDDKVILRLDWGDIDTNGNSTLDADFYKTQTGKKRSLSGVRRSSHHTNSTTNESRNYEWVFREYIQPFKVVINWLASVIEKERMKRIVVLLNELDRKIWPKWPFRCRSILSPTGS